MTPTALADAPPESRTGTRTRNSWLAAAGVLALATFALILAGRPAFALSSAITLGWIVTTHHVLRARDRLIETLSERTTGGSGGEQGEIELGAMLAPVSAEINKLIAAADRSNHELREAIQQERMKTLELEMLANRLEETGRQLEAANEELAAFSYSASHDLAAPLRVIVGLSEILEEDYADGLDKTGREHLSKIRGSAGRLIALVQDLLVLSRLKSPEPGDIKQVRVGDLVHDLVEDLRADLPQNVRIAISGDLPTVEAPPERLRQVLQNLITNGCKFNRSEQPTITIDGWTEGGIGIVRVADNGIGIPEHAEGDVFGLFKRLHGNDEFVGTGAGLAIARRSARSLGGELWIERSSPSGTTFALAVPCHHGAGTPGFAFDTRSSRYLTG